MGWAISKAVQHLLDGVFSALFNTYWTNLQPQTRAVTLNLLLLDVSLPLMQSVLVHLGS